MEVHPPSPATLKKYGLTEDAWWSIWERQGEVCAVCGKTPTTGNTHIDHEHVRNYKKLLPEIRASYVRGITCWFCNRWVLARGLTLEKAKNVVRYLEEYEKRKHDPICLRKK